jgi:Sulfotransferase family
VRRDMKRLPDFIIIGAMKSATTSLHAQLARQPDIFVHGPGELEFFSDDALYARGLTWYASLFDGVGAGTLCGERSTEYTKLPTYPETVPRMRRHLAVTRFIYVMRHPVDRLVSHYMHEWVMRRVTEPIELALERHPEFVSYGCYDLQLRPYLDAFGPARVLPVFFERLVAHPDEELVRVCRFLGYGGTPRWMPEIGAQNVSEERLRRGLMTNRILGVPWLRTLRRRLVPESLRNRAKKFWQIRRRPEITSAERDRLRRVFDDDLGRLGGKLGIPLSCENYKDSVIARSLEWVV